MLSWRKLPPQYRGVPVQGIDKNKVGGIAVSLNLKK